ncbi:hypothetical protein VUR80DRAFT_1550 [Thermomyces stellatus]
MSTVSTALHLRTEAENEVEGEDKNKAKAENEGRETAKRDDPNNEPEPVALTSQGRLTAARWPSSSPPSSMFIVSTPEPERASVTSRRLPMAELVAPIVASGTEEEGEMYNGEEEFRPFDFV